MSVSAEGMLKKAVDAAIQEVVGSLREQAIAQAVAAFERDLREKVAVSAMRINSAYRLETRGEELAIYVKIAGEQSA